MDDADADAARARITTAGTLDELADCDLVIEAASEKEEVKRGYSPSSARC
jgi:3-hydroxybutyryl-CoA dehydrogenase